MPYGSLVLDTISTSGNLSIEGNVEVSSNITAGADLFVSGSQVKPLVLATAQTASGTEVNFTGIPSWVKRVTVLFKGVSSNGTSNMLIQLGTSSGYVTTGYASGSAFVLGATSYTNQQYTTGFGIRGASAANSISGALMFITIPGNTWVETGTLNTTENATWMNAGVVSLPFTLDRLRLTTVNGTDTFDAGTVNIMYE